MGHWHLNETAATFLGFLAASVLPSFYLSLVSPLGDERSLQAFLGTFVVTYPFSVAAVAVLGGPSFVLLRRFKPGHWWSVAAAGFLLGAAVGVIMRLPNKPNPHDIFDLGPLGAASALSFWWIWLLSQRTSEKPRL